MTHQLTASANIDGREILFPTVINGKQVPVDDALNYALMHPETILGTFDTPEQANAVARDISANSDNRELPNLNLLNLQEPVSSIFNPFSGTSENNSENNNQSIIAEYRQQYPELDDINDTDLAFALHKIYNEETGDNIDLDHFSAMVGANQSAINQNIGTQIDAANQQQMEHTQPLTQREQLLLEKALMASMDLPATMERHAPEIGPAMSPLSEPGFTQRIVNRLMGTRGAVTPKEQARSLIAFEAGQQDLTPKEYREQVGTRIGPLERAFKDFGAGAISTGEGMLGYAARLTQSPTLDDLRARARDRVEDLLPADPNFFDSLAAGFGSTATFFVPGLGIAKGVQAAAQISKPMAMWLGAGASGGMEAAAEAGFVYDDMIQQGKTHEEAAAAADKAFWANTGLVSVTNRLGLFGDKGSKLMRRALTATTEGFQEGSQQVISNVATGRPAGEGVGESTAIGAIVGTSLGGAIPTEREQIEGAARRASEEEVDLFAEPGAVARDKLDPRNAQLVASRQVPIDQKLLDRGNESLAKGERVEPSLTQPEYVSDYYKTEGARDLAHRVKRGDVSALTQMAEEMAPMVPTGSVIVPMPDHTGDATTMLAIAGRIADLRGGEVADILKGKPRGKWYDAKKEGKEAFDFGFSVKGKPPENSVIIDSVYDTGETMRQAMALIPGAKPIVHSKVVTPKAQAGKSDVPQEIPAQAEVNKAIQKSADNTAFNPAEARKHLLDDIRQRIPKAADVEITKGMAQHTLDEIGYVEFDVPGDGRFRVLNNKANLESFAKKVAASPGFKKPTTKKPSKGISTGGNFTATLTDMLESGEVANAYELSKAAEIPIAFGRAGDKKTTLMYVNAEPHTFDVDGLKVEAFVGRISENGKPPQWRAIDIKTGLSISKPSKSKKAAIAEAQENLARAGATNIQKAWETAGTVTQDELENRFVATTQETAGAPLKVVEPTGALSSESLPTDQTTKRRQITDNYRIKVNLVETGKVRIGIDEVLTSQDAAHVVSIIRKHPQEIMAALVLDKNQKPITIIRMGLGVKDGATVDPGAFAGAVASIPEAASYYMAHNHPSGISMPSVADSNITSAVRNLMTGTGIKHKGHVVIGSGRDASFIDPDGEIYPIRTTARSRGKSISITERAIRKIKPGFDVIEDPETAKRFIKSIDGTGVVFLDNRNKVIGVMSLSESEMARLRKGDRLRRLLNNIHETNAAAALIKTDGDTKARINIANALNAANVRVLDAFFKTGQDDITSVAETGGEITTGKQFFSPGKKTNASNPDAVKAMLDPGETYKGHIQTEFDESTAQKKPKRFILRREEILREFIKDLGIRIFFGRIPKRMQAAGYYRPKTGTIRIQDKNNIETVAHEVAHLFDDRVWNGFGGRMIYKGERTRGEVGPNRRPWLHGDKRDIFRRELKAISYNKSQVYEGFAEFVRHWMTNPEYAESVAPEFYKWWENYLNNNKEFGPAMKKAKKRMVQWLEQTAYERALSKVGGKGTKAINEMAASHWDRSRESVFDDLHGLMMMESTSTGKTTSTALGPYQTARLTRAAYSIADGAFKWGVPKRLSTGEWTYVDYNGEPAQILDREKNRFVDNPRFTSWGLRDVFLPVDHELKEYLMYHLGRSARELALQGRENVFSPDEIRAMIARGRGKPHFDDVFNDYQAWNKAILDFAESMGVINPENRRMWRRTEYLPMYRVGTNQPAKKLKGIEGNISLIKMLTGGTENVNNIMENIMSNASRLIVESIKNDARSKAVDFATKNKGAGIYIEKIPKRNVLVKITKEQVQDAFLKSMGFDPSAFKKARRMRIMGEEFQKLEQMVDIMDANMEEQIKFWLFGQAPVGENIVARLVKGKPEFYEVEPLVYRSFLSLNRKGATTKIGKTFNAIRRLKQATITFTLSFAGANMFRDTITSGIISPNGFVPVIDSLRGMKSVITRDPHYRAFIANGGGMSSYLVDPDSFEAHVKHFYKKHEWQWIMIDPRRWLLGMEMLANSAEMAARVGEFRKAVKRGKPAREAAFNAREVSTDFQMRGDNEFANIAYRNIVFLKAGLNGLDRIYRAGFKDDNKAHVWLYTGMIALASAALWWLNKDHPLYKDLKDWDKDTNWHAFIKRDNTGDPEKDYFHLRFPKIWEIGAIASMSERATEAYWKQVNDIAVDQPELASQLSHIFLEQFKFDYLPAWLAPLYETYAINRNRFLDRPIVSPELKDLLPFAQYNAYTSPALIDLAELTKDLPPVLQLSPERMDSIIYGYFSTYGTAGIEAFDRLRTPERLPKKKVTDLPGIRRFSKTHPLRDTKHGEAFWEFANESRSLFDTMNKMMDRRRPDLAKELSKKEKTQFSPLMDRVKQKIRDANNEMVQVIDSLELTPEEKSNEIDRLQREKNEVYRDAMEEIGKQVRKIREQRATGTGQP